MLKASKNNIVSWQPGLTPWLPPDLRLFVWINGVYRLNKLPPTRRWTKKKNAR
ncbi:hypothetical protein [Citrobacter pasteurii]|nr:ubiE/COQ5 family methyltransferase domain protein [Shigella flexneri 1235-66]CEJ63897.1 hypothetical protein [Citrobacter pasteurii]